MPFKPLLIALGLSLLFLASHLLPVSGMDSNPPVYATPTLMAQPIVALLPASTDTQVPRTPTAPPPPSATPRPRATVAPQKLASPALVSAPPLVATAAPRAATALNTAETLNGVSLDRILVMTDAVRRNIREIYAKGQALGRNPRAFSKIGDSTMVYPPLLAVFGGKDYTLGKFAYLQGTIDYFGPSLARTSAAAKKGMHTWSEFDPVWVALSFCRSGEGPLACELRLNNPGIAIIRLGANDYYTPRVFEEQLHKIVDTTLAAGVIPVLGTKPDRMEGPANTLNGMIMQTANAYAIPLWDYDTIAATVPGKGLVSDGVHFRGIGSHDFTTAAALASGDSLEDLTALMMLDAIRREVGR